MPDVDWPSSSLILAMIFSPRSDQFPELLHQREPDRDLLCASVERRVEVDFMCADTPAALDVLLDLLHRSGEDCPILGTRRLGDLHVGADDQFELLRIASCGLGHLLDAV